MRKIFSLLVVCIAFMFGAINTANAKEVLPEYPLLKVIEYNWLNGDYSDKNTVENKTDISNKFLMVLNKEENAVDEFLSSNAPQKDKDKAFLKHMHNVQVVATDLSQVVDWILYDGELQVLGRPHTLNKTLYGIEYQFQEKMDFDDGEYYYSYGGYKNNPKIVKYPMVKLENTFNTGSSELHTHGKRVNSYYVDKYKNSISDEAINILNQNVDLSLLDYEAQKGIMDYLISIILFVAIIVIAVVGWKYIPRDKIRESIQNFISESRERAQKIQDEYNRNHCKYCGAKFVNDSSQFCSKCGKSRE